MRLKRGSPATRKPSGRPVLNPSHPLATNLLAAWPGWEMGGNIITDLAGPNHITKFGAAGTSNAAWVSKRGAFANDTQAWCRSESLKINPPLSFAWYGYQYSNPATYTGYLVSTYNDAGGFPYVGWTVDIEEAGKYRFLFNREGSFTAVTSSSSASSFTGLRPVMIVCTGRNAYQRLYVNGQVEGTNSYLWSGINYTSTSRFGFSCGNSSTEGGSSLQHIWGLVWNRELTEAEVRQLWQQPYIWLREQRPLIFYSFAGSVGNAITGESGIVSGEVFGATGASVAHDGLVGTSGIASAEAFGAGSLNAPYIAGTAGIASGEAFGTTGALVAEGIDGAYFGIASGEAFGANGSVTGPILGVSGIASGEAFGAGTVTGPVTGSSGITTGEVFGVGGVVAGPILGVSGIASGEAFGTTGSILTPVDGVTGIVSGEVFGSGGMVSPAITGHIGIESAEAFGRGGTVLGSGKFQLFVRGVDRTLYLKTDTMQGTADQVGGASVSFTVIDGRLIRPTPRTTWRPNPDDEVTYYFQGRRIFGGIIKSVKESAFDSRGEIQIQVQCSDYRYFANVRTYSKTYTGPTFDLRTIVREIWEATLRQEGITYDDEETAEYTATTATRLPFDSELVSTCFDRIASVFGFDWEIDRYRVLRFRRQTADLAPANLRDDNGVWRKAEVVRSNEHYRNRQGIRTSTPVAGQRTTTLAGAGAYSYTLDYPVTTVPRVTVNGTRKTVVEWSARGASSWDFAYEVNSNILRHNPTQSAYTSSDTIVVTSPAASLDVYWMANTAEIERLAARSGGSGVRESVTPGKNIRDIATAQQMCQGALERLGYMVDELSFESDIAGWQPGQLVSVFLSAPLCAGIFVVQNVSWREVGATYLTYQVRCVQREMPVIHGIEIDEINQTIDVTVDRPFESTGPFEVSLWGINGMENVWGTWTGEGIDERLVRINYGGIDPGEYLGGLGGSEGGGTWGLTGGPDPFGGSIWTGIPGIAIEGPGFFERPGGGGGIGVSGNVIVGVDTSTREVTTEDPHGFTTSYPGPGGTRVMIIGVSGCDGTNGSTINNPFTRITVTSPTTFIAEDVGSLAGASGFSNDRMGRAFATDNVPAVTLGTSGAGFLQQMFNAGQGPTNLDSQTATFVLANAIPGVASRPLMAATNVTNPWIATKDIQVVETVSAAIGTPPEGDSVLIDIKQNGVSIFAASQYLEIAPGSTSVTSQSELRETPLVVTKGDKFTVDVVQVGTEFAGCNATVNMVLRG